MRMRIVQMFAALVLACLLLAPAAFAQGKRGNMGMKDFEYTPSSGDSGAVDKRAAVSGGKNLRSFDGSDELEKKKKGDPLTPVYALGLIFAICLCCAPVAIKLYSDNKKRLENEAAFGRNPEGVGEPVSRKAADQSRRGRNASNSSALARTDEAGDEEEMPSIPLASPEEVHNKVWYTLADANKWLSAEGVARLAKLDLEQVRAELANLAQDGHIESSKDRTGRPIYKFIS